MPASTPDRVIMFCTGLVVGLALAMGIPGGAWLAGEARDAEPILATPETRITEDDPRWDCTTMGGLVCGPTNVQVAWPRPLRPRRAGRNLADRRLRGLGRPVHLHLERHTLMNYARATKAELITELEARDLATADQPVDGKCNPWDMVRASWLSGDHLGTLIRVRQYDPNTGTVTLITAELRQVGHTSSEVYAHVGHGAEQEVTLSPDQPVTLRPPDDYADVAELALYDGLV